MAENWDVYICQVDDHPASVFVDLGQIDTLPDEKRPWLLRVAVPLQTPGREGLSDESEIDALYEVEDQLFGAVAQRLRARYVGRITTQGRREFFYYGKSAEGFDAAVRGAMSGVPQYAFECNDVENADWSVYLNLLYPSDLDLKTIYTRRAIQTLAESGDDLSQPREITHWLYFPSEVSRNDFIDQVAGEGFEFERLDAPEELEVTTRARIGGELMSDLPFGLLLTRHDRADLQFLDPLVIDLFIRAQDMGGTYDGWKSEFTPRDP